MSLLTRSKKKAARGLKTCEAEQSRCVGNVGKQAPSTKHQSRADVGLPGTDRLIGFASSQISLLAFKFETHASSVRQSLLGSFL